MAEEIRIRNVQAEIKDEAVPALIDIINAVLDLFVSPIRTKNKLSLGKTAISRDVALNGISVFVQIDVDYWYATPLGLEAWMYENDKGIVRGHLSPGWSFGEYRRAQRVPTADEVNQAVDVIIAIAEHYAVGEWAKKGKDTISRLKKIHRAFE